MKDRTRKVDWGICEGSPDHTGRVLIPFIHHPTNTVVFLCGSCALDAEEALAKGQVPGKLSEAIALNLPTPAPNIVEFARAPIPAPEPILPTYFGQK